MIARYTISQEFHRKLHEYRQQEEKRRNLLSEMEEKISSLENRGECCMGRCDVPTDAMWQLAMTRPLADSDMRRLYEIYPENAIASFLNLLAEDRQVIYERGKKRQNQMMKSIQDEVYREVHAGKAEYNKAREDYRYDFKDFLQYDKSHVVRA